MQYDVIAVLFTADALAAACYVVLGMSALVFWTRVHREAPEQKTGVLVVLVFCFFGGLNSILDILVTYHTTYTATPELLSFGRVFIGAASVFLAGVFLRGVPHAIQVALARSQVETASKLLDLAGDAVMVRGLGTSIITYWNRGAEVLYGYTRDEAIGQSAHELLKTHFSLERTEVERLVVVNGWWEGELTHTTKTGRTVPVWSRWSCAYNARGVPYAALEACTSLDNQRKLAETEQALSLRDQFLSVVAHEMKTPVTAVSGYVQMLAMQYHREMLTPERLGVIVQRLEGASRRLVRMQNRLLDTSRVYNGKLSLAPSVIDLNHLTAGLITERQDNDPAHEWHFTAPCQIAAQVDGLRLEQVLTNLLDNSQKFTPEGKEIWAKLGMADSHIEIEVLDQGPGMAAEQLAHVFERYWQADGMESKGMGLGLWISSEIVKQHGGSITAANALTGGLSVKVQLPVSLLVESPM